MEEGVGIEPTCIRSAGVLITALTPLRESVLAYQGLKGFYFSMIDGYQ